jgi:peptidoglycan-associated lipoprotein
MRIVRARLAFLLCAGLAAACNTTPTPKPEAAPAPVAAKAPEPAPPAPAPAATPAPPPPVSVAKALPPYLDPNNPLSTDRSVFFAFDRSVLSGEGKATIARHGNYLSGATQVSVRVEGNCDERGGAEYNLALGQRRADVVAARLRELGVQPQQIETVSYGKERPRASGHDEASWKQNRRADIVYRSN